MTITQMRQELTDIRAQIGDAIERGTALAASADATLEQVRAASDEIDNLQIRAAMLEQGIARAEGTAPEAKKQRGGNGGFKSFGEFAASVRSACQYGGSRDSRLVRDSASGANEATGADGGFLVPPEYADGIIDLIETSSVLLPHARRVQIAGNRLIECYLKQDGRADGKRHGGVLAYWRAEADAYTATKARFDERTTQLDKLTALCPVTEELLEDHPAVESYLSDLVGREFAWKMDEAMLLGNGSGSTPIGMLTPVSGEKGNRALVTVPKEEGQAAGSITVGNILSMYTRMSAQCRQNAVWYINQDLELPLMQLMTTKVSAEAADGEVRFSYGGPLWIPAGAYGNDNGKLLGRDVMPLEQSPAVGSLGDIALIDPTQYLVVERTGIVRQASMHMYFDTDQTAFKFTWRVGGRPEWMDAVTGARSTVARSPYVALAERK